VANPRLGLVGCVFNARQKWVNDCAELLVHYFQLKDYPKIILAGAGELKKKLWESPMLPELKSRSKLVNVSYSGRQGWYEAIQRVRDELMSHETQVEADLCNQWLEDRFNPDKTCCYGVMECLQALQEGLVKKILLLEPVVCEVDLKFDLEDRVISLCKNSSTELIRVHDTCNETHMFAEFGGIGGWLYGSHGEEMLQTLVDIEEKAIKTVDATIMELLTKLGLKKYEEFFYDFPDYEALDELSPKDFVDLGLIDRDAILLYSSLHPIVSEKIKIAIPKKEKDNLNIVFLGHVDAGKSTLVAQLLLQHDRVEKETLKKVERATKEQNAKACQALSFITDCDEIERQKGNTIECLFDWFESDKRRFTVIDAPGHENFLCNMIAGCCLADIAVLVLSARAKEFEDGFFGGQTKEHARLALAFAQTRKKPKIIVAVNKMDEIDWDEKRFQEITHQMGKFLQKLGYKAANVTFVPVSGLRNLNLNKRESPFSKDFLLDVLDNVKLKRPKKRTRIIVFGVSKENHVALKVRVESGMVRVGDILRLLPSQKKVQIIGLRAFDEKVSCALPGEHCTLLVKGLVERDIFRGCVLVEVDDPISVTNDVVLRLQFITEANKSGDLLSKRKKRLGLPKRFKMISKGYRCMFHCHALAIPCSIVSIENKDGSQILNKTNPVGYVRIRLEKSVCIDLEKNLIRFGRVVLRDGDHTVAMGKIEIFATQRSAN